MIIDNKKHAELIKDELIFQTNKFEKVLRKQAAKMFIDNELYICRFQGYDELRGNIIVKFEHKICNPPRRNENLQCFVSSIQDEGVKNWGGLTYQDLRSNVLLQFDCKTVFFTYHVDHTIVGLSGVKIEDIEKYERNALVFLAPSDPPLQYLINLEKFLLETNQSTNKILQLNIENPNWNPEPLIVDDQIVSKLQLDFIENDIVIIQGPPGTGKTYLMALLCAALLKLDFKILVTALTNRALIELVEKEHLNSALEQGKIYKSALTADESKNKKIKGIQSFKSISRQQPQMLLATYYIMSQIAMKAVEDEHFDYIIIEEASQAFLSTIALARKLGKKCIVIGDINQLEPIFHKECPISSINNFHWMVCGLEAISYYLPKSKQYILTDSYRLTQKSVQLTNHFYDNMLKSKSDVKTPLNFSTYPILKDTLDCNGGCSILKYNLPNGRIPSIQCKNYIINLINQIKLFNSKSEIAVLAFNRDSIRSLQKDIYVNCLNTDNILIETIDRIQGLTSDFCIFFIPNESIPFALNPNRFNVATSRAKFCTLIIFDSNISEFYPYINNKVKKFLESINLVNVSEKLNTSYFELKNATIIQNGNITLNVIDKIDLTKFEKIKKEISTEKENIYIIDTNVFVDYPQIISKIDKKYKIVLSAKVIDELDYLKISMSEDQKKNVQKALKLINESIGKVNINMDTADLNLLPNDFNKKSPDNFILSVALKYQIDNPIMLTSDNALQIKAKGLGITTISLKDFLKQFRY
jgi:rRNA-processing protein FCF1/energy-coupling factor transporter ATP-binding protein EcfA2